MPKTLKIQYFSCGLTCSRYLQAVCSFEAQGKCRQLSDFVATFSNISPLQGNFFLKATSDFFWCYGRRFWW